MFPSVTQSFLLPPADLTNDSCKLSFHMCLVMFCVWTASCLDGVHSMVLFKSMSSLCGTYMPSLQTYFVFNFPSENSTAGNHKYTNSIKLFLSAEAPFCTYQYKCSRKHDCQTDIQTILPVLFKKRDNKNQRTSPWVESKDQ